jgi:hypothetical protein
MPITLLPIGRRDTAEDGPVLQWLLQPGGACGAGSDDSST